MANITLKSTVPQAYNHLRTIVENQVSWQRGVGYKWTCDACIGAEALDALVELASHAPAEWLNAYDDWCAG